MKLAGNLAHDHKTGCLSRGQGVWKGLDRVQAQSVLDTMQSEMVAHWWGRWAVAALEYHPGQAFLEAAAAHVMRRVDHLSATDCSNVLWSFSRLFTPLPPQLLAVRP